MKFDQWPPRSRIAGPDFDCCDAELVGRVACPYSMGRYACWENCGCKEGPRKARVG